MKKIVRNTAFLGACLISLGVCSRVNAATLVFGGDTAEVGKSREITIELKDDEFHNLAEFQRVEFQVSVSGTTYASVDSVQPSGTSLNFEIIGGSTYSFKTSGSLSAGTIGKITYSAKQELAGDFKITPTSVKFFKADGSEVIVGNDTGVKISEGTIKYQAPKSNVAELSSLTVSQGSISPVFSKDVTEYKVQISDTIRQIRIDAKADKNGTVSGGGVKSNLQFGENSFDLNVTSEDGSATKTYKVIVIRGEVAEPSAYLKSLDINNIGVELSPSFDPKNNKYTVTIGEEIDELTFKWETEDPTAKVEIEGNKDFEEGENLVKIKVTSSAENPEEQVYEITVIKEIEESEEESTIQEKPIEPKKTNIWLIVGIVVGILAVVGGVVLVLFKKKNKNKKGKNDKNDGEPPVKTKKHSLMEDDEYEDEDDTEENSLMDEYAGETTENFDSTMTLNRTSRLARRDESVTDILKGELFEDEKTRQFDSHSFREIVDDPDDDGIDKTKEFDFRDFE